MPEPEQIVAELWQIEVLMSPGKTVPQACKEISDYFLHWNFAAITPTWGSAGPDKACSEVVCYVRCWFEGGAELQAQVTLLMGALASLLTILQPPRLLI